MDIAFVVALVRITISNCTVRSPNFGNATTRSGVPSSYGPIHPITNLYGGIAATNSPITKIGARSCTN